MTSLSVLQTEREKLRAEKAQADYEADYAATASKADLVAASAACRDVLLRLVADLPGRMLDAIHGAHDETRVHYLMSDAAHDLLRQAGQECEAASGALPVVGERIKRGAKPRDLLTVSQWADRNRWIRTGTNSPGQWRTALTPYLQEIMDSLSEHSPVRTVSFIKASGLGGPLALNTPIPTASGWTSMGDIKLGDVVFDENGAPCRVIYVSPVFEGRQCYEVQFSDGAVITCDDEHRWMVHDSFPGHNGKKRGKHRVGVVRTTAEIAGTFLSKGRRRYSIPVAGALQMPDVPVEIQPYVLGYWLANGNRSGNQCTAHEDDAEAIITALHDAGQTAEARKTTWSKGAAINIKFNVERAAPGTCIRGHDLAEVGTIKAGSSTVCAECHRQHFRKWKKGLPLDGVKVPPGFLTTIKKLGLYEEKHIPEKYLRASIEQRWALLQGLMDGDGSATIEGRCEYSSANAALAEGVMELLHSLGFKPVMYRVKKKGFGEKPATTEGEHLRISFAAYSDQPVFKIHRKQSRLPCRSSGMPSVVGRRRIVDVRPVSSVPVRCIGVDSGSHLYLCGREMIPTHNTEALNCWIGYIMAHLQNKDTLVVMPTLELRDRSFNPRIMKMLDETPCLAELVSHATRSRANRNDLLEYGARARIIKAGANSPDSLRSDHLPYVICDEVDAFPWDVGGEGDPMTLIENRQRTYSRAKSYYVSTPTTAGQSRIDVLYQRSDRRRYHVPCPHCGEFQHLEWKNFKYRTAPPAEGEEGSPPIVTHAWYVCRECGAHIEEGHKPEMLAGGKWIAERPHIKLERGYHLNTLYAPIGLGLSWKQVAQKWLTCQGDSAELKAFINTYLGEVWQEQGDSIENLSLMARAENYTRETLPLQLITAGADVQKDRIEVSIAGWGEGEECWLLDHIILPGDTAQAEVWQHLEAALSDHGVQVALIDSGYNTTFVYSFCETRPWAVPGKGVSGIGRPLVEDFRKRQQRLRTRYKRGQAVEPIGVDQGKSILYARLKRLTPGPEYIHFPNDAAFDEEYFAQLAAERLVTKFKGHRPFQEWVKTRPRNEALDCLVYALAAYRLLAERIASMGAAPAGPRPEQRIAQGPATPPVIPPGRTGRSSYLR